MEAEQLEVYVHLNLNGMNKSQLPTMYNRNYGGFDYVGIHSELLPSVSAESLFNFKP
jgi:hypothetical protein